MQSAADHSEIPKAQRRLYTYSAFSQTAESLSSLYQYGTPLQMLQISYGSLKIKHEQARNTSNRNLPACFMFPERDIAISP